jgi:hypothetical protein
VPPLWNYIFGKSVHIDFAHRTFKWTSETENSAAVHVVIISLSQVEGLPKFIFVDGKKIEVSNINAYLLDAPNVIIEPRSKSLYPVPPMIVGSCPTDGGNLILSVEERAELLKKYPAAEKFVRQYIGSEEFINGKIRYCLWLKDATPAEIKKITPIYERVKNVREFRLASKKEQTRRRAEIPTLFAEDRFVDAPAIFVPMVSSENRQYIPFGFIPAGIVANNKSLVVPNGDLFLFGVLTSSVHMAWVKVVAGRLEMRYSYGVQTVYNTFPFCQPTEKQRLKIEETAKNILDVRNTFLNAPELPTTLAELYDPIIMPKDLKDAHRANNAAVEAAYDFSGKMTELEIVVELLKMYQSNIKI